MGRMSFAQELKALATASEGMDAGECWSKAVMFHRELGRAEHALGRAAWTLRYGSRGEWRAVLRDAAAELMLKAGRARRCKAEWRSHTAPLRARGAGDPLDRRTAKRERPAKEGERGATGGAGAGGIWLPLSGAWQARCDRGQRD